MGKKRKGPNLTNRNQASRREESEEIQEGQVKDKITEALKKRRIALDS